MADRGIREGLRQGVRVVIRQGINPSFGGGVSVAPPPPTLVSIAVSPNPAVIT